MARPVPLSTQHVLLARVVPWLPPQQCVSALARVSRSAAGAIRTAFEVVASAGEDLRPILASRVPHFGTLRVPRSGCVLTGAINEPLHRSVRIAPLAGRRPPSRRASDAVNHVRVELHRDSLYGLVEFRCARLCLEGLQLCGRSAMDAKEEDGVTTKGRRTFASVTEDSAATGGRAPLAVAEDWAPLGALPLRLSVDGAVVTCRSCVFEAELRITLPCCDRGNMRASLVEGCSWSCSPYQGLVICGVRPEQGFSEYEEEAGLEEAFASAGLTALRTFAGELDAGQTRSVIVPNGLRLCVVRNCEAREVRQHALLLRWDVCVLVERCAFHGKVLIEEGPTVELRRNPHLVLDGERLDPGFIGTLRGGRLEETPLEARTQRRSGTRSRPRRQVSITNSGRPTTSPESLSSSPDGEALKLQRGRSLTASRAAWALGGSSVK